MFSISLQNTSSSRSLATVFRLLGLMSISGFLASPVLAQTDASPENTFFKSTREFFTQGEWYASWGYDKTHYHPSDVHVSQPSLNNDFVVHNMQGHDEFKSPVCCTPDNVRVGRFFDENKNWALDLSLDHTKFTSTLNQTALVTGTNAGGVGLKTLSTSYFTYLLHNGLNHVMVSALYRKPLLGNLEEGSSLSLIAKVGTGLAIVHPEIDINGQPNSVGNKNLTNLLGTNSGWWRIVGTSTGEELGFRYVPVKPLYLELTNKQIYTSMRNIPVYKGTASQNVRSNEMVMSVGYIF